MAGKTEINNFKSGGNVLLCPQRSSTKKTDSNKRTGQGKSQKRPQQTEPADSVAGLSVYSEFFHFIIIWFLSALRGLRDPSPQPGMEPAAPAVEVRSPSCWTAGEVLIFALTEPFLCLGNSENPHIGPSFP